MCLGYRCSVEGCEVLCSTWSEARKHVATHPKGMYPIVLILEKCGVEWYTISPSFSSSPPSPLLPSLPTASFPPPASFPPHCFLPSPLPPSLPSAPLPPLCSTPSPLPSVPLPPFCSPLSHPPFLLLSAVCDVCGKTFSRSHQVCV